MAKGVFPEDHPLACGMTGIWGTRVANDTMRGADVVARRRHGVRRSRLQLVAARAHVCDPADAADPDRHRPAGDRQDLPGRGRHRRRRARPRCAQLIDGAARPRRPTPTRCSAASTRSIARRASWQAGDRGDQAATAARRFIRRACSTRSPRRRRATRSTSPTSAGTRTAPVSSCRRTRPRHVPHQRRPGDDGLRPGGGDRREDRRAGSDGDLPGRRRRLPVGVRRADHRGRARTCRWSG